MKYERITDKHLRLTWNDGAISDIRGTKEQVDNREAECRACVAPAPNVAPAIVTPAAAPAPVINVPPPFEPLVAPVLNFGEEAAERLQPVRAYEGPLADALYAAGLLPEALVAPTMNFEPPIKQCGGKREQHRQMPTARAETLYVLPPPPSMY